MKVESKAQTPPPAPKPHVAPPQKAPAETPAPAAKAPEHLGRAVDVKA
jgi:hypothetical protein